MKKYIKCIVAFLLLILTISGVIKLSPIFIDGYNMYKDAIEEMSIEDKVEQIRQQEGYVPIKDISPEFRKLVVSVEDHRFYWHFGLDLIATGKAFLTNIKHNSIIAGGSTITQQLAKNMYFTFEKKYERKVAELLVAFKLEWWLTKKEILELYCNIVYFGNDCYGIKEAAKHYYGIQPDEINKEQASALVKTLKSPNANNPNRLSQELVQ